MNAIQRLCQRVILLEEGCVKADGDTVEVVSQYLNADRASSECMEWSTPSQAPGDDTARLKRVRVLNRKGEPCTNFEIREPVQLEVEFWSFSSSQPFMPLIFINNDSGVCVLETVANQDPLYKVKTRKKGVYRSVVTIPGNFFNEGLYSVDISIRVMVPRRYFVRESGLLSFRVEDSGSGLSVKGEYIKPWSGIVAPLLPWETTIHPLGSGDVPPSRRSV